MMSRTALRRDVSASSSFGRGLAARRRQRLAVWAAVVPMVGMAGQALATDLYWDTNGTAAGSATTGTWTATSTNWTLDANGTTALGASSTWQAGSIAHFSAGTNAGNGTVTVVGTQQVGGFAFEEGNVTLTGSGGTIDLGSAGVTITTSKGGQQNSFLLPVIGSGTLTVSNLPNVDTTLNLDGVMTGFTGNIVVSAGTSATQLNKLQLSSPLGNTTSPITLNNFSELSNNNVVTRNDGTQTPVSYTIANPISLTGGTAWLASANGRAVTYSGVISGNANLVLGIGTSGGRGTVVLGAQNTYTGDTSIVETNNNGLVQLGVDNALPTTTNLTFGSSGNPAVAPFDFAGHNQTLASIGSAGTGANAGLFNTSGTPVTLTLNQNNSTTFKGIVGSTSLVAPWSTQTSIYPAGTVTLNSNISIVKNGTGTLTLSAAGNQIPSITINGGAINFTSTNGVNGALQGSGSNGVANITVNPGGTIGTGAGNVSMAANITAAGGAVAPGGAGTTGNMVLSAGDVNFNSGSTYAFDWFSSGSFDTLSTNGAINLDSNPHNFSFNVLPGGTITPGTYVIATASNGVNWDGTNSFTGGTVGAYNYGFSIDGAHINLLITPNSPVLRWSVGGAFPVQEGSGDWGDGSGNFINLQDNSPATWSNAASVDVIVGGDTVNAFDNYTINLPSPTTVNGKLTLSPITAGFTYTIGNGAGNALTLNPAAGTTGLQADTSGTINAPVTLGTSQTWTVNGGSNVLLVTQPVTGPGATLTKNGSGIAILTAPGGSMAGLTVTQGALLVRAGDAIGATTPVTLDGGGEYGADASVTMNNPVQVLSGGGQLVVSGGNTATLAGAVSATGAVTKNGAGVLVLSSTANTFASTLTLAGSAGSFLSVADPLNITGASVVLNNGGLRVTAPITIPNNFTWSATGNNGLNDLFDTGANAVTLTGSMAGSGDWHKRGGGTLTIAGSSTAKGGAFYLDDGSTIVAQNVNALGLATIAITSNGTFQVDVPNVNAAYMRGDASAPGPFTAHKTGTGNLTLAAPGSGVPGASNVDGTTMAIDAGSITMDTSQALGGNLNKDQMDIVVNAGGELIANYAGSQDRVGGSLILNGGTVTMPASAPFATGADTNILQAYTQTTASGVTTSVDHGNKIDVKASSTIRDLAQSVDSTSHAMTISGPVLVETGATLTADNENAGGFDSNNIISFRGSPDLTAAADATHANAAFPNDTLTIQPGATLATAGPGQVRFGQSGSRGKVIVGQGTGASSESVVKFGSNAWLNDSGGTNAITRFIVSGSGNNGLRLEGAMNATYRPASDTDPTHHDGSTGLFGQPASGSAPFTVMSSNRLNALSAAYGSPALPVGGTLTVAANDATDVVGSPMLTGPSAASPLTLAFDNTASSANANLTYQLDGSGATGGNIANFAHLQVQKSNAGAGSVKLALAGNTKISDVVLLNGTKMDITNKVLAIDYTGSLPSQILPYIDAQQIYSSNVAADADHVSTIARFEASDYMAGTGITSPFGLSVDSSTLLLKAAWYGDINLDGVVNADDYALMDRSVAMSLPAKWFNGDFNADNAVNSQDYFLMDKAYGITNGRVLSPELLAERQAQFGSDYVSALVAAVPEPGSVGLVIGGALVAAGRRRRTR